MVYTVHVQFNIQSLYFLLTEIPTQVMHVHCIYTKRVMNMLGCMCDMMLVLIPEVPFSVKLVRLLIQKHARHYIQGLV